jgi:hypothetical protein
MLELIVELYAPFAPPDTLASAFVEPSSLVQDRTSAGSDECVLTDLVASVATAFPERDVIATTQRTDALFGPIISALGHSSSVRSPIGNDYAISGDLYINYLVALHPNIIRHDCAFLIQLWILCSSVTTTPLLAAILMVCEHTTDCVCCIPGLT